MTLCRADPSGIGDRGQFENQCSLDMLSHILVGNLNRSQVLAL